MEQASCEAKTYTALIRAGLVLACASDVLVFAYAWLARSSRAVYSVWDVLPAEIMGWFFLSTVLLIYARTQIAQHETLWHRLASFVHLASWTSLVIILSPFGFGFDQVVHQASELFLRTHGWIGLPSPLYAGQYWLVAGISWIMRVDVRMVDTLLAPIAFLFAMRALAYATRVKAPWMTMAIALPLSLFAYGTFTVPWHTGIACAVGAMAGCWYGTRNAKKLAWVCTGLAILIHPLAGIPATGFMIGHSRKIARMPHRWLPVFFWVVTWFFLCFLLLVLRHQATFVGDSLNAWREATMALFAHPYASWLGWDALSIGYRLWFVWPWILSGIGLYGIWKFARTSFAVHVGVLFGVAITAWLLAGTIRFTDVALPEQFEFALRLWRSAPVWVFPGIILVLQRLFEMTPWKKYAIALGMALITIPAWYLLYPQTNAIATTQSASLSQAEIDVVKEVEARVSRAPYLVLAPQMVSVAWVREEGFGRTIVLDGNPVNVYAIPTGGGLYALYLRLWREPMENVVQEAFARTNAEEVVIVVPGADGKYTIKIFERSS